MSAFFRARSGRDGSADMGHLRYGHGEACHGRRSVGKVRRSCLRSFDRRFLTRRMFRGLKRTIRGLLRDRQQAPAAPSRVAFRANALSHLRHVFARTLSRRFFDIQPLLYYDGSAARAGSPPGIPSPRRARGRVPQPSSPRPVPRRGAGRRSGPRHRKGSERRALRTR